MNKRPCAMKHGAAFLWLLQMDRTGGQVIEGLCHGGGQIVHHIGLDQYGGGFEADREDGRLIPEVGAQPPHHSGAVFGGGEQLQQSVRLRVGPAAVVQSAAGGQQGERSQSAVSRTSP